MVEIGLSTVYNIKRHTNGYSLVEEVKSLGIDVVELNIEVPESMFPEILSAGKVKIYSVHNFFPKITPPAGRSLLSAYSLSSENMEERTLAIKYTKKSIDYATMCTPHAVVVVHAGEVGILHDKADMLYKMSREIGYDSAEVGKFAEECKLLREKEKDRYLNNVIMSLEEILLYAEEKKVKIGLETRFHFHEIPSLEEFGIIFDKLPSPYLGYWHDVGHAEILFRLGFVEDRIAYLRLYKEKLFGMHVHDVKGIYDHRPPGSGEINFSIFKEFLNGRISAIMEVVSQFTASDIKDSVNYLKSTIS
jgi:sugar phosphate isomerase/epimerase